MLTVAAYTLTSALGSGVQATLNAILESRSGLRPCDFEDAYLNTCIGRVAAIEAVEIPAALTDFDCRNNRLALLGLSQDDFVANVAQARDRFGAERIGVFIGTTTSGIHQTELAYRDRDPKTGALPASLDYQHTHNAFSCADFTRRFLELRGPAHAVLTACSSSVKVFATAHRAIMAGLCDAAVVGGVDSLCLTTLYGFNALQLLSTQPCRPWDANRDGLSIGEAAGFALLRRTEPQDSDIRLLGYGESLDAYHMTAPHPQGTGAKLAMNRALQSADLTPAAVDYIHLHGTATPANDIIEDQAVLALFGCQVPCSSTKGWTGHTLGAAGITSAIIACLMIEHGFMPASLNTQHVEQGLAANILLQNRTCQVQRVLINAFGFGGDNGCLLLGHGV
ncbi:MAG: beta-ketoacyl-[acyl-carrier-protein] synthase family protein [Candidatus Competibacteraceae bacterium]|jgi:3-oxoacyl-[acyl-carrier-protein] synthase-1|nr:beta-ketoacyl-[acyl-carrier-protein] synthase family protein [Candidatus Competibacteraceae bacterium]